jgi:hypothetical protein
MSTYTFFLIRPAPRRPKFRSGENPEAGHRRGNHCKKAVKNISLEKIRLINLLDYGMISAKNAVIIQIGMPCGFWFAAKTRAAGSMRASLYVYDGIV